MCSTTLVNRKMQIKLLWPTTSPKSEKQLLTNPTAKDREHVENRGTFIHCWWRYKLIEHYRNQCGRSSKIKNKTSLFLNCFILRHMPRKSDTPQQRCLYPYAHFCFIHYIKKTEPT